MGSRWTPGAHNCSAQCHAVTEYPHCEDCGGSCVSGSGCFCPSVTTETCVTETCALGSNECCPFGYYWNSSASCCTDVFMCSPPCAGDEVCVNRSNIATCECNEAKNIGKTIEDFKPTVDCDGNTMTTSVSKCLLTYLGYNYTSLHVKDKSIDCSYHYSQILNDQRVETNMVRAQAGWCGITATIINSNVYFMNTLHIDLLQSVIITKNPIAYNFTCGYNLTMQTSLAYALKPVSSATTLTPVTGGGSFSVTMAAYKESSCTITWENEETVAVGTDIYLGIFLEPDSGDNFTVRVDSCLASASNNSNDSNQVSLVENGCAIQGEVETQIIANGESKESIIKIKAFQFQASPNYLFIFCQVSLCDKGEECKQCHRSRSADANVAQLSVNFPLEDLSFGNSASHKVFSWTMMVSSLLTLLYMKLY
uniref:ZP domain-containing protein n=1 Tax=Leptobrachium leishanense TaxID=445787 RepID=A0A8C5M5M6_9ANUR